MANVSTSYKRTLLRILNKSRTDKGLPLADVLLSALTSKYELTSTGAVLVGTSSLGSSVTYQIPSTGVNYGPFQIVEAIEELLTLRDQSASDLVLQGIPTPTDDQIFADMLTKLVAVDEVRSDFLNLRIV